MKFSRFSSDTKILETDEVLSKNHIVEGQGSWDLENSQKDVPGYKLFGKSRKGVKVSKERME